MSLQIRVGIRPSQLALRQAEEIKQCFKNISFDLVMIKTKGDKDKTTSLTLRENSSFFTYEIEEALLSKEIDLAIHSAKDLENDTPQELIIAATTKSINEFDCLVSSQNFTLETLPANSRIGTSSANRRKGIINYRKDLVCKDIRGNIEERLAQLYRGDFDAIVVAHAALLRLGLEALISQVIPFEIIKPHPLQGRLAIQTLRERGDLVKIFGEIDGK